MARCSRSSSFLSAFHAASVALPFSGRGKKLLPFSANDPRWWPSILRRTAYFQYAACSATSQMLWRPGAGRHAASTTDTPLSACFRFGPCQVFLSYASSNNASTSFSVFTPPSREHPCLKNTVHRELPDELCAVFDLWGTASRLAANNLLRAELLKGDVDEKGVVKVRSFAPALPGDGHQPGRERLVPLHRQASHVTDG